MRLRQRFGAAAATQVVLEYQIADWLRLQSSVGEERGSQSSLFQRIERSGVNWVFFFSY